MKQYQIKNLLRTMGFSIDQPWEYDRGGMGGGLFTPILRDLSQPRIGGYHPIIADLESPTHQQDTMKIAIRTAALATIEQRLATHHQQLQEALEWPLEIYRVSDQNGT